MAYIELQFQGISREMSEVLIAQLADMQYEGFEETEDGLKAYIPGDLFQKDVTDLLTKQLGVNYTTGLLPDTNWNELWESNFQPVVVEEFCATRADFHEPIKNVQHEIIITPKMSFGTGHHPTTYMMIGQMRDIDFNNKTVMDFGTGTGVLAILAGMLGAKNILAIDNDDWSIANAEENIKKNNIDNIKLQKADTAAANEKSDIILANITKNVILANFSLFREHINKDGILVLSGLLEADEEDILTKASSLGFTLQKKLQRNGWISLKLAV